MSFSDESFQNNLKNIFDIELYKLNADFAYLDKNQFIEIDNVSIDTQSISGIKEITSNNEKCVNIIKSNLKLEFEVKRANSDKNIVLCLANKNLEFLDFFKLILEKMFFNSNYQILSYDDNSNPNFDFIESTTISIIDKNIISHQKIINIDFQAKITAEYKKSLFYSLYSYSDF